MPDEEEYTTLEPIRFTIPAPRSLHVPNINGRISVSTERVEDKLTKNSRKPQRKRKYLDKFFAWWLNRVKDFYKECYIRGFNSCRNCIFYNPARSYDDLSCRTVIYCTLNYSLRFIFKLQNLNAHTFLGLKEEIDFSKPLAKEFKMEERYNRSLSLAKSIHRNFGILDCNGKSCSKCGALIKGNSVSGDDCGFGRIKQLVTDIYPLKKEKIINLKLCKNNVDWIKRNYYRKRR
jgi:hypothetical protein